MKKKILIIISLILVAITFSACSGENYDWDILPGGPAISDPIIGGNSGVAVQKGDYIYMINGAVINGENNIPTDNKFGVPEKGAIYRLKLDDNGNIMEDETRRMAPKVFYSRNAGDGLYIPDNSNKLYYISPGVSKDKYGDVLFSHSDIFSVNLDGTGTKKLGTVNFYYFSKFVTIDSKVYFVYDTEDYDDEGNLVHKMMALSEDGNLHEITREYTLRGEEIDAVIGDDEYIYYTRSVSKYGDDDQITGDESFNMVYRKNILDGVEDEDEQVQFLDGRNISEDKNSNVKLKYNVDLIEFKDGVLYYTKNIPADSAQKTLYFAYKDGKEYQLNYLETLTKPYFLGFNSSGYKGTLFYSGSSLVFTKADSSEAPVLRATLSAEPQYLFMEEDTLYLMDSGKMYSVKIFDDNNKYTKTELTKDFKITMDLERYFPKKIGDFIYFIGINADAEYYSKYLYRHDITKEILKDEDQPQRIGELSEADKELKEEAEEK